MKNLNSNLTFENSKGLSENFIQSKRVNIVIKKRNIQEYAGFRFIIDGLVLFLVGVGYQEEEAVPNSGLFKSHIVNLKVHQKKRKEKKRKEKKRKEKKRKEAKQL